LTLIIATAPDDDGTRKALFGSSSAGGKRRSFWQAK
jgi:hypothetical protein